ncbi:sterol desaturase family protein [Flavobacterium sp. YO12]|uniref:sterol desaturase family protein n=1 Tax=Flavobacterium sp. YO12 TaxID=1920029 RepID=UPI00100AA716|nr:sterol desaturase family protein [Flavobacterium sp. YO12]RXM48986.1 sterol desaturase [Flavobacterium sp. YO12]
MIVENLLQQLSQIGFLAQLLVFTIENGILLLMAVLIGKIVEPKNTVLNIKDRKWVISTLICNIFITALGFKLYQLQLIRIDFSASLTSTVIDTLILIILMDFFMFCFHYLAHTLKWFYPIHKLHHTHVNTNVYSLFVLHPIETLGFGFIWLILISIFEFNYISLIIYLFLNLMYGIFGHLQKDLFPAFWHKNFMTKWISTTKFHGDHHKNEAHNFGFYFTIWDKIFKTSI